VRAKIKTQHTFKLFYHQPITLNGKVTMTDLLTMLAAIRRPKTLMRTARIGLKDYRRAPVLKRLLGFDHPTATAPIVLALLELEAEMNSQRTTNSAAYSAMRHVDVMIALMSEAQLLRGSRVG
jgi:hypothetical protein